MYPCTLMRTIYIGLTLCKYYLRLIRTIGRLRTHDQLETSGYATSRTHNPVPSVAFVEFRTFTRAVLRTVTVEDYNRFRNGFCPFCIHLAHRQHTGKATARVCPSVHQVTTTVIVPKRCGVNHALTFDNTDRVIPFAGRIFRFHHKHTIIWITPINVVFPVMVADARSPYAVTMTYACKVALHLFVTSIERLQCITNNSPIDQILRMQDGETWCTLERTCRKVIIFARCSYADIRVAIVGIDDRIGIGPVTIVRIPHLGNIGFLCLQGKSTAQHAKGTKKFSHKNYYIIS